MSNQTASNVYLTFNGNAREAMTFYKECLGAELEIMNFEGTPMEVPASAKNNVLHSTLKKDGILLMASDTMPGQAVTIGDNLSVSINCISQEQTDTFYTNLIKGGSSTMPLQKTFWGAYFGMLKDKFGVNWMFNFDEPQGK